MHIEDGLGKRLHERGAQEAHEAGQADEIHVPGAELGDERAVVVVA